MRVSELHTLDFQRYTKTKYSLRQHQGIIRVPLCPQAQCLQALQQEKGRKRVHRGAKVPQDVQADLDSKGCLAERLDEAHAVVPLCGLGEVRELAGGSPVELAAVYDDAAEDGAVAPDPLRRAVGDNVCTVLDGPDEVPCVVVMSSSAVSLRVACSPPMPKVLSTMSGIPFL